MSIIATASSGSSPHSVGSEATVIRASNRGWAKCPYSARTIHRLRRRCPEYPLIGFGCPRLGFHDVGKGSRRAWPRVQPSRVFVASACEAKIDLQDCGPCGPHHDYIISRR